MLEEVDVEHNYRKRLFFRHCVVQFFRKDVEEKIFQLELRHHIGRRPFNEGCIVDCDCRKRAYGKDKIFFVFRVVYSCFRIKIKALAKEKNSAKVIFLEQRNDKGRIKLLKDFYCGTVRTVFLQNVHRY